MRTLGKVVLAPTIASGLVVAGTAAAQAMNVYGFYNANGVNIRTGPSTHYTAVGEAFYGQGAHVTGRTCSGQSISGDPCWSYAKDLSTGKTGWTWSPYVSWSFVIS